MGEVQTWSLNKRGGVPLRVLTYLRILTYVRNARMLAFDWLGQCLYGDGKANMVGIVALLRKKKNLKSTRKTIKQYLER